MSAKATKKKKTQNFSTSGKNVIIVDVNLNIWVEGGTKIEK